MMHVAAQLEFFQY